MTERLKIADGDLHEKVRRVLDVNLSERHIRGGEATKNKYRAFSQSDNAALSEF